MAAHTEGVAAADATAADEEVKPYTLHISSRYLDLTRQKLEVTRLPHESSEPKSQSWWEPKSQVEPLIDFWLEHYSWRAQEEAINSQLPQFRTAVTVSSSEIPVRIHFVHIRSDRPNSIPLLIIPPFPVSNLSLGPLVAEFASSDIGGDDISFDLVVPSLPGVGFSDALPNNTPAIPTSAELLNSLMTRLSYPHYLVTTTSSGNASPAGIDYNLANYLASRYTDSCLGAHLIAPPITRPKLKEAPVEWAKYTLSSLLNRPILGYRSEDFSALARCASDRPAKPPITPAQCGLNQLGLREPNTLAYALCDSPTGLLVFVLKCLRLLGSKRDFSPTELVTLTQLAWLPGPEGAMRFWAYCAQNPVRVEEKPASRPSVAITVFLGDEPQAVEGEGDSDGAQKDEPGDVYSCPSWARPRYKVLYTHRAGGRPGLLVWERPDLIVAGARGLAAAVRKLDPRLRQPAEPATAPLTQVVTEGHAAGDEGTPASPPEPVKPTPALLAPPTAASDERGRPHRGISDETTVASTGTAPSPAPPKAAGHDPTHLAPPASPGRGLPHRQTSDDTKVASTESIPGKTPSPVPS